MEKLKNCPLCGTALALSMEFSVICLECGMEFKVRRNPTDNMAQYIYDPGKAAREVIEMFNRRTNEVEKNYD